MIVHAQCWRRVPVLGKISVHVVRDLAVVAFAVDSTVHTVVRAPAVFRSAVVSSALGASGCFRKKGGGDRGRDGEKTLQGQEQPR